MGADWVVGYSGGRYTELELVVAGLVVDVWAGDDWARGYVSVRDVDGVCVDVFDVPAGCDLAGVVAMVRERVTA